MITEFKSKEQLADERSKKTEEELKKFFSDKDYVRICRVFKDEAEGNDRLVISNSVIKAKFKLRKIYVKLNKLYEDMKRTKKMLELNLTADRRQYYEDYSEVLNEYIESLEKEIFHYGALLIHSYIPLLDKYFSDNEIIQIVSGSDNNAKRIKYCYDRKENGQKSITDSFIIHHIEYRWKKGRCKDFVDCPEWEMPLFNCVSAYMWKAINSNSKAKADMDNFFEEIFEDAMIYTVLDSNGNIIGSEKVVQTLTQNELIKSYQGSFINELKKKAKFDGVTIYRVKRVDNMVYHVIGEDKCVIASIYKKVI